MSSINDGGSAFPLAEEMESGRLVASTYGMTLRDYFAAAALPAIVECMLTKPAGEAYRTKEECADMYAKSSYLIADAMLKARAS